MLWEMTNKFVDNNESIVEYRVLSLVFNVKFFDYKKASKCRFQLQ
jgi:hypothetical protein